MLRYKTLADNYIKNTVGTDFSIVLDSIQDLNDFFCFTYQNRRYIETGDILHMAVGQGYTFIKKSDHRVFSFGSRYSFDLALSKLRNQVSKEAVIRKAIPHFDLLEKFSLKIISIYKKEKLIHLLLENKPTYVIPEVVGNSIFRVPKDYNKKSLSERLLNLPVELQGLNQERLPGLLLDLVKTNCCQFKLIEKKERNLEVHADKASDDDMEPIW